MKKSSLKIFFLVLLNTLSSASLAYGQAALPFDFAPKNQEIVAEVKAVLNLVLQQYCKDACQVISVQAEVGDNYSDSDDLGFEGLSEEESANTAKVHVSRLRIDLQVDNRVNADNRERLALIVRNSMARFTSQVDLQWLPVTLPEIGNNLLKIEQLREQIEQRVSAAVESVIAAYCPDSCILSQVTALGKQISADDAASVPEAELLRGVDGQGIFKIEKITVDISMDQALPASMRAKIGNIMKAKTRFVAPVHIDVATTAFPSPKNEDSYGLEKLRQTLTVFRDLAATKEIITTNSNSSKVSESGLMSENHGATGEESTPPWQWAMLLGALILVLGFTAALVGRFIGAGRDAQFMMAMAGQRGNRHFESAETEGRGERAGARRHNEQPYGGASVTEGGRGDISARLHNDELRRELIKSFMDAPRVAKETFTRLLQEEGIEQTAKYVHLFGHLVVFELLGDPNLQRELYELSEYYHKSNFNFSLDEEFQLLTSLKTRVTANEIRVMTRRQTDQFDFLTKLEANQIYTLIGDEKAQIQSLVLTQLDPRRRRAVFELYAGQAKVELMRELCRADAIPKEYLSNVAKALSQKMIGRPEFDTQNLRSSDILLDLLEKAALTEQRGLMANLVNTNPEAAKAIKLKLVTVEILPYLKDSQLLEIVLGLERSELLTFLAGSREHIRGLLLSKAPEELATSWLEELEQEGVASDQSYRLVEMKLMGRVRTLANSGSINLLDINDQIFANGADVAADQAGAGQEHGNSDVRAAPGELPRPSTLVA